GRGPRTPDRSPGGRPRSRPRIVRDRGASPPRRGRAAWCRRPRAGCRGRPWPSSRRSFPQAERADAAPADLVARHVEPATPGDRPRRVENGREAARLAHVAERRLEEAGPHRAVGFDDAGDPRSVAFHGRKFAEPEEGGEVVVEAPPELLAALGDEAVGEVVLLDRLDLSRQEREILGRERHGGGALPVPAAGPVERFAGDVGGEKTDAVEADLTGRGHRGAQFAEVLA